MDCVISASIAYTYIRKFETSAWNINPSSSR